MDRTYRLNANLSDPERLMLTKLADAAGLGISDTVRQLIRNAYAEAFPEMRNRPRVVLDLGDSALERLRRLSPKKPNRKG